MYNLCVVGCGAHSKAAYGPSLARLARENKHLHLAGCCDTSEERANEYAQAFGFEKAYQSTHEMIADLKPHGLCLVLPVSIMAKTIIDLAPYHVPILGEKPPANTLEEMEKMIATTGETPVQVAFNRRYVPLLMKFKEDMDKARVRFLAYDLFRVMRCEDSFHTTAIHALDAVRYLTASDYEQVDITYQPLNGYGKGVANVFISGRMKNHIQVRLNLCPVSGAVIERAKAICDEKTIYVNTPLWMAYDKPGSLKVLEKDQTTYALSGGDLFGSDSMEISSGFYGEIKAFIENTMEGRALTPTLEESLQSVALCEALARGETKFNG